jgi:hypothetical protein
MEAVAHNQKFAEKVGIPRKVGQEFAAADAQKKHKPASTPKPTTKAKSGRKGEH